MGTKPLVFVSIVVVCEGGDLNRGGVKQFSRCAPYLLLHASLQQQHDAGFNRQSDLTPTPLQVFLQGCPEGWLLCPLI